MSAQPLTAVGRAREVDRTLTGDRAGDDDSDIRMLVPLQDAAHPELSIVIPSCNEQNTVAELVRWCHTGLSRAGIVGEIIIVDSSTDDTVQRALAAGARVLCVPRLGLGRAYKDAISHVRGRYILMGDADCTYDFRDLAPFVERLREGYEFVMGSRWKGSIEQGAMPALHQYLGTPVTTWVLNRLYSSGFSDIHCGMRGVTRRALVAMELESDSWEYASEMVLKSVQMDLSTTEVPVHFLKDRDGRVSHHKRQGWRSPFLAAWSNLRAMFVYGSDFFLLTPGLFTFVLGLVMTLPLTAGPITLGSFRLSLYWMLIGTTVTLVGLQAFLLGCIAQVLFDYNGRARKRWLAVFSYDRSLIVAAISACVGIGCDIPLVAYYVTHHDSLSLSASVQDGMAVTGLMLMAIGFMLFTSTLVLHGAAIVAQRCFGQCGALAGETSAGIG